MTIIDQIMIAFQELVDVITASPEFQAYGVVILFLWTIIPSVKSIVPEVFALPLLLSGVSPAILVLVAGFGATVGDFIIHLLGRGSYRLFKGKFKEQARADHLLHKYKVPIFLATPFIGIVGDILVFTAGIEHVPFRKIFSFLLIGQLLRMSIGMIALMGIIQLPEFFGI